jgi:hypothetical protein
LVSSVNPETDAKNAMGPRPVAQRLDDDENLAGLLLIEPRCLGKEECTDEVIDQSFDFR